MTQREFLEELKSMTPADRLMVAEAALRLLRADLPPASTPPADREALRRELAAAAKALLPNYSSDKDLTAFTSLDSEDFHA